MSHYSILPSWVDIFSLKFPPATDRYDSFSLAVFLGSKPSHLVGVQLHPADERRLGQLSLTKN